MCYNLTIMVYLIRKHFYNFLIPVFVFIFLAFPFVTHAQSVSLTSNKTSYTTNDSILISVSVETSGHAINTVDGNVTFNSNDVSITDVRYGTSIISLWVKKPIINASLGIISFTGGMPGGFTGSNGPLFTFVIKPKRIGEIYLSFSDIHVLLNDGSGAELQGLKLIPLRLNITQAVTAKSPPPKETTAKVPVPALKDTLPPENFVPMVSHHPSVSNNDYFVAFFAVDKDSGIARYEVREKPAIISMFTDRFSTDWKEGSSPYILSYQNWASNVEVRAFDQAGNSVTVTTYKSFSNLVLAVFIVMIVLLSMIITRKLSVRKGVSSRRSIKIT